MTLVSLSDNIRLIKEKSANGCQWDKYLFQSIPFIMQLCYSYSIMNGMDACLINTVTICHISPLCHSFIATLQLGLLDCHNSTRKCWNKLLIMRFVLSFIKVLKISRLFRQDQDQDQDQDFLFKTKTFISRPKPRPRPFFMSLRCLET